MVRHVAQSPPRKDAAARQGVLPRSLLLRALRFLLRVLPVECTPELRAECTPELRTASLPQTQAQIRRFQVSKLPPDPLRPKPQESLSGHSPQVKKVILPQGNPVLLPGEPHQEEHPLPPEGWSGCHPPMLWHPPACHRPHPVLQPPRQYIPWQPHPRRRSG